MTPPIRPLILVQTTPQEAQKDTSLIISARLYDRDTLRPMPVREIYMNIVSLKDGHEVWPNEVIRRNTWKMDIEISTKEMQAGHKYLVRISNNRNQSPQGSTEFKIIKNTGIVLPIVPFIPMPVLEDEVKPRMILHKIFRTQMDARVCPICMESSLGHSPGLERGAYYQDDPQAPEIPVHFNCRCTYDIIFKDEFEATIESSFMQVAQVWQASQVVETASKWPTIFKALDFLSKSD